MHILHIHALLHAKIFFKREKKMVLNMRINLIPRPCLQKFGLLFAVWFLEPCKGFPVTEPLTPCVTTNPPPTPVPSLPLPPPSSYAAETKSPIFLVVFPLKE